MIDLSFKLQSFEGPLDLLLHLIEKNKVDIYDIPIAQITNQYFEYIDAMREENMDIMSEFLVMAATLLDIKSRMLLPPEVTDEGEEIDPRSDLVEKLLEYKLYKYMAYELKDMETDAALTLYREADIPQEIQKWRPPVRLDELLKGVTLENLESVFREVLRRQEDRKDPIRSQFGQIEQEEVDSSKIRKRVSGRIRHSKTCTFHSLLTQDEGKMYVVVTFLTVLELIKIGCIDVQQEDTFGEITITAREEADWTADLREPESEELL